MDIQPFKSGKVREIYDVSDDLNLIVVASDRISAFDCVLPTLIPDKGKILTTLSVFWFARTGHIADNHLLLHRVRDFPAPWNTAGAERDWEGRAMLVRRAEVLPVECVVRGYLAGSGWKEYQQSGSICGVALPSGLREGDRLPEPIFTPSTKAEVGAHDLPITFDEACAIAGEDAMMRARRDSLALYSWAHEYALQRDVIIADTKFEWGWADGDLIVVDEMLTPDSSRFWSAEEYQPGHSQPSFDKQFVRDYLETLTWDKQDPAPTLPSEIVAQTAAKYHEAYQRLTGLTWPENDVRAR